MKLTVFKREGRKENYKIRVAGNIPAVLYGPKYENENIYISGEEFQAHLRALEKGQLATTVFTLHHGKKKLKAIIKDIQYQVTSYDIIHLDFEVLADDVPVSIRVPIQCTGVEECIGVKLGGTLRQVIRSLKVRCLPKDIPTTFFINVQSMEMMQSKRLVDIPLPKNVVPLANMSEVAIVIAKR